MSSGARVGVIAMAYGTPRDPDEVAAYYTHILGGRTPPPELVESLRARYDAIGYSPLRDRTEAQRDRLASALGRDYLVTVGYKHTAPFIEDAVAEAIEGGAIRLVGVVLAPHYSRASVGEYLERLRTAAAGRGVDVAAIESWHDLPEWVDFQATAVGDGLAALPAGSGTKVLFSAHSLPERVLAADAGDPYADQLHESASAVARQAGLDRWAGWSLCWQSAGRSGGPWRGPDVLELLDELAATGRATGVLVCPQGFTCEHLEVLYDLDIAARHRAEKLGLAFGRTRMINDDATVLDALARRIANLQG